MNIFDAAEKHPQISKLVNRGSVFAFSDGKGMTIQQRGDGSLSIYAWSRREEEWMKICGFDAHNPAEVKESVLKSLEDWTDIFKDAVRAVDDASITPRSLYILTSRSQVENSPWSHAHRRRRQAIPSSQNVDCSVS